jgi:hypothetical protein
MLPTDVEKITREFESIGHSTATLSSFNDKSNAQVGDFLFYKDENGRNYHGKVLDDSKVLLYQNGDLKTRVIVSLDYFTDASIVPTFFTDRDISSNYAFFTTRANS